MLKRYEIKAETKRKTVYTCFYAKNEYEAIGIMYEYLQVEDGKIPANKLNKRFVKILYVKEDKSYKIREGIN